MVSRPAAALDFAARAQDIARLRSTLRDVGHRLGRRTVWHVNSTSEGGGVAELLRQLLGYLVDGGIDCRWLVLDADAAFFEITKRIHNRLHGTPGDGGPLRHAERAAYVDIIRRNVGPLLDQARSGDVVVLHDPQTAGLAGPLVDAGITVIWVCHVGVDVPNDIVRSAWQFLLSDVKPAHAYVFSRRAYAWDGLPRRRIAVIPPCIDPTSLKNADLDATQVTEILRAAHVFAPDGAGTVRLEFDGVGTVDVRRPAEAVEEAAAPSDAPLVVQISRWDRLKDHAGVLRGFARHVRPSLNAHLLLVGPPTAGVADDPEGPMVFGETVEAWDGLPSMMRGRVHLLILPMEDHLENALMVNALQRAATVVVQKSLAEGFGLTVAEAMWKTRPVVASRVGGIQDQIRDGHSGLLVEPSDLEALGRDVTSLVSDAGFAQAIGHAGRERIRSRFLPPQFLGAHLKLIDAILRANAG